jgi:hypothetical protein
MECISFNGRGIMINISNNLTDLFKNSSVIKADVGCTIEYNMNSMIEGIAATTTSTDAQYIAGVTVGPTGETLRLNPFKKLFPVDSIIRPFRPTSGGVKYFITLDADTTLNSFESYRSVKYSNTKPRVYYPGVSTFYKYWVTPKDVNADVTVTYKQASSPVTGNKHALANKIVVKFDKYHALPTQYRITVTPETGSAITTTYTAPPSTGLVNHYWNGTNWSTTTLSEPVTYSTPQSIKSIRLEATNPGGGKVIGVIEVSARWIKDLSSDIEVITISKESSSSSSDIIPIGYVTANSINLSVSKYDKTALQIQPYNRYSSSLDSSLIYAVKNAELKPYFKIYHSNAVTVTGSYDKVPQGTYYINDWSISEYGDWSITALDGAKYLMDTFVPDIFCENYPVTAIFRRLLDSVGFTDYNFNLVESAGKVVDTSIPQINYWWSDNSKTVWECIQELCRDIQMNAVFDDFGVLQFSSREYIYGQSSASWTFYSEPSGSILPNIVSFSQKEVVSANQVKIRWRTPVSSQYIGNSTALWQSPDLYLSAGGLKNTISSTTTLSQMNDTTTNPNPNAFIIETEKIDAYTQDKSLYNFSGYLLVDSEIFEFDAIQYQYTPKGGGAQVLVWIESDLDINKYRYLSEPGYADQNNPVETSYFRPTGRYRIKSRAALGTTAATHTATAVETAGSWMGRTVTWR